ncbi:hypothetical protein INR49_031107 [Caranx melampygus]|nr:hypothetical protein INR49_031107 [Caranx melampygus]
MAALCQYPELHGRAAGVGVGVGWSDMGNGRVRPLPHFQKHLNMPREDEPRSARRSHCLPNSLHSIPAHGCGSGGGDVSAGIRLRNRPTQVMPNQKKVKARRKRRKELVLIQGDIGGAARYSAGTQHLAAAVAAVCGVMKPEQ